MRLQLSKITKIGSLCPSPSSEQPSEEGLESVVELAVDEEVVCDRQRGLMYTESTLDGAVQNSEPVSELSSSTVGGR